MHGRVGVAVPPENVLCTLEFGLCKLSREVSYVDFFNHLEVWTPLAQGIGDRRWAGSGPGAGGTLQGALSCWVTVDQELDGPETQSLASS